MHKYERVFQLLGGECNKDRINYIYVCPTSRNPLKLSNGQVIKKTSPNEAHFLGRTLTEDGDTGRDKRMEKIKVLLNSIKMSVSFQIGM